MELFTSRYILLFVAVVPPWSVARADIYRWDNHELIPGTEAADPGPGIQLAGLQLPYADFREQELAGSSFEGALLDNALFRGSYLIGANFDGANLTNAEFQGSVLSSATFSSANLTNSNLRYSLLSGADFENAIIHNASFRGGTDGFTAEQLMASASYKEKNLSGISFDQIDFKEVDFNGFNFANASFNGNSSSLARSDFRQADLSRASFSSELTDAQFDDSIVKGAKFESAISTEQLYSTRSYKEKELGPIRLILPDTHSWDFSGQNLKGSVLGGDGLKMAKLDDATIRGGSFSISADQLYSTESYRAKDLRGIKLSRDLSSWNFAGQNLADARLANPFGGKTAMSNTDFRGANLTRAQLNAATLTNANLSEAVVMEANFSDAIDFTENQLYSTASYRNKDLQSVKLSGLDLRGWDFRGQDLSNADLSDADLTGANFDNANLFGADLLNSIGFSPTDRTHLRNVIHTPSQEDLDESGSNLTGTIDGLELGDHEHLRLGVRFGPILVKEQLHLSEKSVMELDVYCGLGCGFASLYLAEGTHLTLGGTLRISHVPRSLTPFAGGTWPILHLDEGVSGTFSSFELPVGNWDVSQLNATGEITLTKRYRDDGDVNVDGQLDYHDIDRLSAATRIGRGLSYDLNADRIVDQQDRVYWVHDFKRTWFGDANLDGEFNSGDLIQVFQAREYEDGIEMNSGWAEGDWNGDGDFNTADFVVAFADDGYEKGQREPALVAVPEPESVTTVFAGLLLMLTRQRKNRNPRRQCPHIRVVAAILIAAAMGLQPRATCADIFRWDTGELIPGTQGIDQRPGAFLPADLRYADLRGANLTSARFIRSDLAHALLRDADLTGASFGGANLDSADLSGANVEGAYLWVNKNGITSDQIYSTQSYQNGSLRGIRLLHQDLSGWELSGQDLTRANLQGADLTNANLENAILYNADLRSVDGYSPSVSTNTRHAILPGTQGESPVGEIAGIELQSGEHFLIRDIEGGGVIPAIVRERFGVPEGTVFESEVHCFLYCESEPIVLADDTSVSIGGTLRVSITRVLASDRLSIEPGAGNELPLFEWANPPTEGDRFTSLELPAGDWDLSKLYTEGNIQLISPYRYDGDVNVDNKLDAADIDQLSVALRSGRDITYDLNKDSLLGQDDLAYWAHRFKQTWIGDANLDGEFNSGDLVQVFQAREYEDGNEMNSGWAEGDWNGDGDFDTSDLVYAFQDGGYEMGQRGVQAVPEPCPSAWLMGVVVIVANYRCRWQL